MKKIHILTLTLFLSISSFGQQTNPSSALTKQDYLLKSKKQKKVAVIMLGGGAALVVTGVIIPKGESKGFTGSFYGVPNAVEEYKNDGIKAAFGLAGSLSMIGSIPFFVASRKNKKRGMRLSLINEKIPRIQKSSFVYRSVPSVSLTIDF